MNGTSQDRPAGSFAAVVLCALALVGLGLPATGSAAAPAGRPPVVLIVMDEIPTVALMNRSGGISASRFPNFQRLSREGVWYRNHTTVAGLTRHSVPGILSGRFAEPGDPFATVRNYPDTIFNRLRSSGYRVQAVESISQICPRSICRSPARRFLDPTRYSDSMAFQNAKVKQTWKQTRGGLVEWARGLKLEPGNFVFHHFLLPHHPYERLPSGQEYAAGPMPEIFSRDSPVITAPVGSVRLTYQRMMLQIGYLDRMIGVLRNQARRLGVWKSMMLVVVGDHGIELQTGRPFRTFQSDTAGSVAFTPLFVKYPGKLKGGVSNLPTRGIDVFPTIADVLGAATPPTVDGEAISQMSPGPRDVSVDGVTVPFSVAEQNRKEAVIFRDRLLGTGGLFRLGVAAHLIGRRVGGRPVARVRLDNALRYRSLDPNAESVPALISGTAPTRSSGEVVAVSVNGVIRGTAEIFKDRGRKRFGTIVNPRYFRQENEIGVHLVKHGRIIRRLK